MGQVLIKALLMLLRGQLLGLYNFYYNWRRPPIFWLNSANVAKKVKSLRFGWNATLFANAAQVRVATAVFVCLFSPALWHCPRRRRHWNPKPSPARLGSAEEPEPELLLSIVFRQIQSKVNFVGSENPVTRAEKSWAERRRRRWRLERFSCGQLSVGSSRTAPSDQVVVVVFVVVVGAPVRLPPSLSAFYVAYLRFRGRFAAPSWPATPASDAACTPGSRPLMRWIQKVIITIGNNQCCTWRNF